VLRGQLLRSIKFLCATLLGAIAIVGLPATSYAATVEVKLGQGAYIAGNSLAVPFSNYLGTMSDNGNFDLQTNCLVLTLTKHASNEALILPITQANYGRHSSSVEFLPQVLPNFSGLFVTFDYPLAPLDKLSVSTKCPLIGSNPRNVRAAAVTILSGQTASATLLRGVDQSLPSQYFRGSKDFGKVNLWSGDSQVTEWCRATLSRTGLMNFVPQQISGPSSPNATVGRWISKEQFGGATSLKCVVNKSPGIAFSPSLVNGVSYYFPASALYVFLEPVGILRSSSDEVLEARNTQDQANSAIQRLELKTPPGVGKVTYKRLNSKQIQFTWTKSKVTGDKRVVWYRVFGDSSVTTTVVSSSKTTLTFNYAINKKVAGSYFFSAVNKFGEGPQIGVTIPKGK
jgi:hypothetical protein